MLASFAVLRPMAAAALLLGLSACASVDLAPLSSAEVQKTVSADRQALDKEVEPLAGELTLEEAIARAIQYNAERRVRLMEEAVAAGQFELGNFDMLPRLVASAGYRDRDSDLISRSKDSVTGAPSLANPSISSSRSALSSELGFSWSLLDFGQSYYAAKQNADRVLIAAERRRKALHNLVQDVRTAYWRVVAAEKLNTSIRQTIRQGEEALADARKTEEEKLKSPLEPLRYQRQLLENLRMLELVEQELSTARIELAGLTHLPILQVRNLVEPRSAVSTVWLDTPVEQMETYALLQNPDLRESIYNARIAQQETRRAMLKMFPGLSFNFAVKNSDDSYLINQTWQETGVQVSFNLLGFLSMPAQRKLAEAGVTLAEQKRMATQMAVVSQVNIARLQYANAAAQFNRADAIASVDQRLADHVNNQVLAERQTKLDSVSQQTSYILSTLRRYQALSNAQAAGSRLQASLGLELPLDASRQTSLAELKTQVAKALNAWEQGKLPAVTTP
ncbi:TolC family protein [Vogesella sp. DC21W]|uniref:TolC family protein n=1 Tax=Vogesella aquatica TaxID=2984206 RepID=A0ABT5IY93_9NEIS|nr:TolC family protein [Vogesella aquatica]MDC7717520.1 TolC family protein [Vogesella aquatica]